MSRQLEPNSTQTPDLIFDDWLPLLTANEAKVVFFIVRKTYGWGKRHERMGAAQIVAGTGMSRSTVFSACASLEAIGLLLVRHGERGGKTNDYALNVVKADEITTALKERQNGKSQAVESENKPSAKSTLVQNLDYPSAKSGLGLVQNLDYSKKQRNTRQETEEPPMPPKGGMQEKVARAKFVPPTIEEVRECFTGHGKPELADSWYGYWDSVNWWRKRGVRMARWRSAVAGWVSEKKNDPVRSFPSRASPPMVGGTLANAGHVQQKLPDGYRPKYAENAKGTLA